MGSAREPEEALLLLCARTVLSAQEERDKTDLLAGPINWGKLTQLAAHHGVSLLLQRHLGDVWPQAAGAGLGVSVARGLNQQLQLSKIVKTLDGVGIRVLPYKGPTLGVLAYGDPGVRIYEDLDILIRPEDLPKIIEILEQHGFKPDLPQPSPQVFVRFAYEYTLKNDQSQTYLELHWKFLPQRFPLEITFEQGWQGRSPIEIARTPMFTLGPEYLLLVLCVHGSKHCWCALIWICDVAELIRNTPNLDWSEVFRLAKVYGCTRPLLLGLCLARDTLGAPVPDEVRLHTNSSLWAMKNWQREHLFSTRNHFNLETKLTQLLLRDGWRDAVGYLLSMIFYPTITDLTFVTLPPRLGILYYFVRPIAYPWTLLNSLFSRRVGQENSSRP